MTRKERAEAAFGAVESDLQELSRWLYENPEIQYQEYESSARLASYLADHGFTVDHPTHGLDTAFAATVGTSGPRVVICCEYDALPEIGQACGHNIIATAAVGAGIALAGMAEELGITVTVLGTPAEEGGGGKVDLIDAGALSDAAASMMVHPSPHDLLDPSFQARTSFTVEYYGKESHAAFAPQQGVNALDAFVQAYLNVATLRQQILPSDRVHCIIDHGGDATNIIPKYTKSTWGIRSGDGDRLAELIPKVHACFQAAAQATGCRVEINQLGHPYLNMANNDVMTALFAANSASSGTSHAHRGGYRCLGRLVRHGQRQPGRALHPPDARHRHRRGGQPSARVRRGHHHPEWRPGDQGRRTRHGIHHHRHGGTGRLGPAGVPGLTLGFHSRRRELGLRCRASDTMGSV